MNQNKTKEDYSESDDDEDYIIRHSLLPTPATHNNHPNNNNNNPNNNFNNSVNSFKNRKNRLKTFAFILISSFIALTLLHWYSTTPKSILEEPNRLNNNLLQLPTLPNHLRRVSFDDAVSGLFQPNRHSISWLDEAGDGVYSEVTYKGILLNHLNLNSSETLIESDHLVDPKGNRVFPESFTVSSDLRYVLVATDSVSQWRHSKNSKYWIYDTLHKTVISLHPDIPLKSKSRISIAKWSPTGHSIAYVLNNDIYLITSPSPEQVNNPIRLTTTGTPTVFNGICDWVYEEEVLEASAALWWSPDSSKLVWLSLDESHVPTYEMGIYNPSNQPGKTRPYPMKVGMKYPKPGFKNPIASIQVFDLASYQNDKDRSHPDGDGRFISPLKLESQFEDDDRIVMEVAWVDAHQLIIRYINRIATREHTGYFNLTNLHPSSSTPSQPIHGKLVMDIDFVKFDGGWAEPGQFIKPIIVNQTKNTGGDFAPGYLDVRIDPAGYRHIAYFSPPDSGTPVFLSHGPWEVAGTILAVDFEKNLVYFIAANPSTERHLYSVKLPTRAQLDLLKVYSGPDLRTVTPITSGVGYYSASFSGLAGFYLLNYDGPGIPWQKFVKVDDPSYHHLLESNNGLVNLQKRYALPTAHFSSINNSVGQEMNVKELRPYGMDLSGKIKYPVLFKVYGGPNSQMVTTQFSVDWNDFLSSSLEYLVVFVDGRGTGFKGRPFRVGVRNQLGKLEALDVATAAQYYAGLKYVDPQRIGIWGWSYGGYLTCKTAESYSADFSMALAVAPVTDWKFYDSIYTERYMSTPALNGAGYEESAVSRAVGFGNLSFSLAHGSADDNVHLLNSAQLLDRLTAGQVRGFQFRLFPDSDHSISTRGAYRELMVWMTDFLLTRWGHARALLPKTSPKARLNHARPQIFNLTQVYSP